MSGGLVTAAYIVAAILFIFSLARLSKRSLLAVLVFMGSGIITVYVLRHLLAVLA